MRSTNYFLSIALGIYLIVFFGYLLGPLVVMSVTAFNSPSFPKMTPWECLTFEWFTVLANDERILTGIQNSLIVGAGTVVLSVTMGLAAALLLTQIWPRMRATYYTVVIAPILIPGVVLGISTLVFWDRINIMLGLSADSFLHNGVFLTIMGQSTFIASYCMLVFISRLERFDTGLTEAALDLGATNAQAFRKILLPFLSPAIGSAAVLAFLASFENYNTTTFTFGKFPTLTIELAQKVRYGINPSISALAFIIVVMTIFGALAYEVHRRRKELAEANGAPKEALSGAGLKLPAIFKGNPAAIALVAVTLASFASIWFAGTYSPTQCKQEVRELKRLEQDRKIEEIRRQRQQSLEQEQKSAPPSTNAPQSPGKSTFGNVFAPSNLNEDKEPKAPAKPANPNAGAFGGAFNPGNLEQQTPKEPEAPPKNPGAGAFGNVFDPGNLGGQE